MSVPLQSLAIESFVPVYSMSCADAIYEYSLKKKEHKDPSTSLEEAAKVQDCVLKSKDAIKDTPCAAIHKSYSDCLSTKGRLNCKSIKLTLEECTAKHIGKLD